MNTHNTTCAGSTRSNARNSQGYVLLSALVITAILFVVSTGLITRTNTFATFENHSVADAQALQIAEAGIDKAIYQLNQNGSYTGETNTALPGGQLTITVSSIDASTKRITSTGYVPTSANPIATRVVKASTNIGNTTIAFRFGVQIGDGGVSMNNGSQVNGSIYSNGSVSGSGTITGDATAALGVADDPDQKSEIQNSGFNLGDISAHTDVSMGFKPSVSATLARTTLNIKKIGSPSDISIYIVTDNAGKPSKTVLSTGTISASSVGSAYDYIDVTFSSTTALTASTQYWIIAAATVNASNYFVWGDDTGNGYANGTGKYSTDWNAGTPVWNNVVADLSFRTYMDGAITSISGVTVNGTARAHSLSSCTVKKDAFFQTISGCSVLGTQYPGSIDPSHIPLPITSAQITDWETTAVSGGTISGNYNAVGTVTMGPKKIDGDLTITNNATIKLTGPLWVNGNIDINNNGHLTIDPSLGSSGVVIIADATGNTATKGIITLSNNSIVDGTGIAGSYPMLLSTNTGANAISLSNNGASVIFYAPYGTVSLSNNASGNQITAYRLTLSNNSAVNYLSGLQNQNFSDGPGGSWGIVPGSYVITN
jgi:hypothetical protein